MSTPRKSEDTDESKNEILKLSMLSGKTAKEMAENETNFFRDMFLYNKNPIDVTATKKYPELAEMKKLADKMLKKYFGGEANMNRDPDWITVNKELDPITFSINVERLMEYLTDLYELALKSDQLIEKLNARKTKPGSKEANLIQKLNDIASRPFQKIIRIETILLGLNGTLKKLTELNAAPPEAQSIDLSYAAARQTINRFNTNKAPANILKILTRPRFIRNIYINRLLKKDALEFRKLNQDVEKHANDESILSRSNYFKDSGLPHLLCHAVIRKDERLLQKLLKDNWKLINSHPYSELLAAHLGVALLPSQLFDLTRNLMAQHLKSSPNDYLLQSSNHLSGLLYSSLAKEAGYDPVKNKSQTVPEHFNILHHYVYQSAILATPKKERVHQNDIAKKTAANILNKFNPAKTIPQDSDIAQLVANAKGVADKKPVALPADYKSYSKPNKQNAEQNKKDRLSSKSPSTNILAQGKKQSSTIAIRETINQKFQNYANKHPNPRIFATIASDLVKNIQDKTDITAIADALHKAQTQIKSVSKIYKVVMVEKRELIEAMINESIRDINNPQLSQKKNMNSGNRLFKTQTKSHDQTDKPKVTPENKPK